MKTVLITPYRIGDLTQPHLATAALAAYLSQHGYQDTRILDLNIEFHDYVLSSQVLRRIFQKFGEAKAEARLSLKACLKGELAIDFLLRNVERAKDALRRPETYNQYSQVLDHFMVIKSALDLMRGVEGHDEFDRSIDWELAPSLMESRQGRPDDLLVDYYRERVIPPMVRHRPDLIGISVNYNQQVLPSFLLASELKRALPAVHITMGGNYFTNNKDRICHTANLFRDVDSIVIYEGEEALLKLASFLDGKNRKQDVPNLFYPDDGEVQYNQVTPGVDMDELPTPTFKGIPFELYLSPHPVLPLLTSRGCYWKKCAFCVHYYGYGTTFRIRNTQKVLDDLEGLSARYRTRYFYFVDEAVPPKTVHQLSRAIIDRNLKINWYLETRFEKYYSEEVLSLMSRAGCRLMIFGMESYSGTLLKKIEKGISPASIRRVMTACHQFGIGVYVMVIVGFPGETRETFGTTLKFLRSYRDRINVITTGPFVLCYDSQVDRNPEKFGVTRVCRERRPTEWFFSYNYEVKEGVGPNEAEILVDRLLSDESLWKYYPALLERPYVFFLKMNQHAWHRFYSNLNPENWLSRIPTVSKNLIVKKRSSCTSEIRNFMQWDRHAPFLVYNLNNDSYLTVSHEMIGLLRRVDGRKNVRAVLRNGSSKISASMLRQLSRQLLMLVEKGFLFVQGGDSDGLDASAVRDNDEKEVRYDLNKETARTAHL